ncbi:hypothetical protein GCM10009789_66450 [Kribbella sancticallisti]|uniref:Proline-rich protein n=1 Tax=Kribbella sancticallisti TaxID=460087 RepID=A0ABP4QAR5_9ACTN
MNSTLTGPVATYLAEVRAELSDLPPGELEDVLEDVSGHLTEVAAEFEDEPTAAALQDRLGTPRQYADELRTAAGYPPRTQTPKERTGGEPALRWGVIASTVGPFFLLVGLFSGDSAATTFFGFIGLATIFGAGYLGVRALRGKDPRVVLDTDRGRRGAESVRGVIDQIPPNVRHELVTIGQPVWWVARGIVGGGGFFALFGAGAVAVVGALAGAAVSVWIGRRTQQDRRWLWYVVPLNVVATIIVPAWLALSFVGGTSFGVFGQPSYDRTSSYNYSPPGLSLDGTGIDNVYPFDEQGRPVKVRLYDQDGKPINLQVRDCAAQYGTNGNEDRLSNVFPMSTVSPDADGNIDPENCKDSDKADFVPPPAPATTPATPTPTPPGSSSTPSPNAKPSTPKPGVTLTVSPTR